MDLTKLVNDISSQVIQNNADYITERVTSIIQSSMKSPMHVEQDTSKLIGYAASASVVVAVELSSAVTASLLAELGILERDEHPHLHVVKNPEDQK